MKSPHTNYKTKLMPVKIKKKDKILLYKKEHPFDTLQNIGDYFNVSRVYVHKVLKNNGLPTTRLKKLKVVYCLVCGNPTEKQAKVCKGKCYFKYYNIKVNCAYCRIPFYRKRAQIKLKYNRGYNNIYCSNKCYYRGQRDGLS